jgi:hypothetical protein
MKAITIRMPDKVASWLREKAARETIKQDRYVSINVLCVDVLTGAMEADKKKGD